MVEPEAQAREKIDKMLIETGWIIQDYSQLNLGAAKGIAVREFPIGKDAVDYALFIDRVPVGVVEAKPAGWTLSGVTEQSEGYLKGLHEKYKGPRLPPFSYETTSVETLFADRRDPEFRSRHVFTFHTPEALSEWLKESETLRARLKKIPILDYKNLWNCQEEAVKNLEDSFTKNRQRALIQMATGSGKTFTAVTASYRLIKHAKVKRILFLVDRSNLGRQTEREFQQYSTPDDGRKITELYNVKQLTSNTIDPVNKVVITTIQRLYSILKGEKEYEAENEEKSVFELAAQDEKPIGIQYNPDIPISEFDVIIVDECHRSIYNKWKQVLDYFDAFIIGLTATPSKHTIGFFDNNQVMTYTHERAVADGVNVGYQVYRIRTEITQSGGKIDAGEIIEKRDKLTREKRAEQLDEDIVFEASQLDRNIVAPDQIRLVVRTFRDRLGEIFPGRNTVPKTLVFAKDDSHAEDITRIIREEFGKGNEFCKKITYRTTGEKPEDLIASFRNSPMPRIAVTVDMIATGTDIRPLECILFMRDVKSKLYFDQMKGRGTRIIKSDDLIAVTPDATTKDHFVIVDAVGVCDHAMTDTHSLERKKGLSFEQLVQMVAEGRADEDTIETLASRLARLDQKLDNKEKSTIKEASGGNSLNNIINRLLDGVDTDKQIEKAKEMFKTDKPTEDQVKDAVRESISFACKPFDNPRLRDTLVELKQKNEQIIDSSAIDRLIGAGFSEEAKEQSEKVVKDFKEFIEKNKDEILALQIIYSKPYKMREITFNDIKNLADAIGKPPYRLSPDLLWSAYERLEKSRVRGSPKHMLTDLISLIRFAMGKEQLLIPFEDVVTQKFEKWLSQQESSGRKFTQEQKQWLGMIKEHIASSVSVTLEDLDLSPFNQKGGRLKLYNIFGDDYQKILEELHEVLISQ